MGRTWTADFDFYPTIVDGHRASVVVDLAALGNAPDSDHPTLITVRVPMRRPRQDGLRDSAELEPLGRLEDGLIPAIEEGAGALSVGRMMVNGVLVFYLYGPPTADDAQVAVAVGSVDWDGYEVRWAVAPDPDWRMLREILAPDPYTLQGIWNRRLLRQFAAHGDDASAAREVDHSVLFPSADAASTAARQLLSLGFRVDDPEVSDDGTVRLSLHRDETLADDAPDLFVAEVLDVVVPLGGDYDGWGASVMVAALGEA